MMNKKSIIAEINSESWLSPTLIKNRLAKLDFKKESAIFAKNLSLIRTRENLRTIDLLAQKIFFLKSDRVVIAVPAFVGELSLEKALHSMALASSRCKNSAIVILLNADSALSKRQFIHLLNQRLPEIASVQSKYPHVKFYSLANQSSSTVKMGAVRGLLVDAIAIAAHRAKLANLYVISNDADQLTANPLYASRIKRFLDLNSEVDGVDGDVSWGSDDDRKRMPEIVLNEIVSSRIDRRPERRFIGPMPTIHGWGANSAFRLGSYCALGGYDYRLRSGEDIELLQRMEVARVLGAGSFVGFLGKNIRHFDGAEIVTDPRNLICAILSGKSIYSNFDSFFTHSKRNHSAMDLVKIYQKNKKCLQSIDLRLASAGNRVCLQKIHQKIKNIYLDQSFTRNQDPKSATHQMEQYLSSAKGRDLIQSLTEEFLAAAISN